MAILSLNFASSFTEGSNESASFPSPSVDVSSLSTTMLALETGFMRAVGVKRGDGPGASNFTVFINQSGINLATGTILDVQNDGLVKYVNFTPSDYTGQIIPGEFTVEIYRSTGSILFQSATAQSFNGTLFNITNQNVPAHGSPSFTYTEIIGTEAILFSPENNAMFIRTDEINFLANLTSMAGTVLVNSTLYINDELNETVTVTGTSNVSSFFKNITIAGDYNWSVEVCDNSSSCSFSNRRFFEISTFDINSENFSSNTFETSSEMFTLNITTIEDILNVEAFLNYDGQLYDSEVDCEGTQCIIESRIDIPLIPDAESSENKTFFWQIEVFDGTNSIQQNTTENQQNVSRIYLEFCDATFTTQTLNFTSFDEQTNTTIAPFSFGGTFDFWLGGGTTTRNNSFSAPNNDSVQLCISPNDLEYNLNGIIEYDENSTTTNYTKRNYFFGNDTISNQSQLIPLGLLQSEDSTSFILRVQDTDLLPVGDVLIFTERYYPEANEFRTVQVARTDDNGQTVGFFETETVDYRFRLKVNGTQVLLTDLQKIVGETVPFTLTFTIGEDQGSSWEGFEGLSGLTFINGFNSGTNIYNVTYADNSGEFSFALLEVYAVNSSGPDNLLCSVTSVLSSGTLACDLSGNSSGSYIAKAFISRTSSTTQILNEPFSISAFAKEAGNLGLFLGWIIILIAAFAFAFNELAGLFLVNTAVIGVNVIGLVNFGWVFVSAMVAISITIAVVIER